MGNREVRHRMDVSIPRLMHLAARALAAACALAGCGSGPGAAPHPAYAAPSTTQASPTAVTPVAVPPSPPPEPPPRPRVSITRVRTGDGALVTVATFLGPVRYVLPNGSADPGAAAGAVRAGPVVTGAERRRLLAAFNGGFKLSAGRGQARGRANGRSGGPVPSG
jgi:hypothetical protein